MIFENEEAEIIYVLQHAIVAHGDSQDETIIINLKRDEIEFIISVLRGE